MALYRKKGLTNAEQFRPGNVASDDMFFLSTPRPCIARDEDAGWLVLDALHDSWISLEPGDYLVRGTKGEYYPIKEAVFHETYESVKDGDA